MNQDHAHVMPVDDWVAHTPSEECVCCPWVNPVKREDGSMGWVVVHHGLDGRELPTDTEEGT